MSDIEMREAIDRVDTGLPDYPDLAGIMAGGRRRRHRTQAVRGAAVLATVATVAQVSFLAGSHHAPSSGPGGAASVAPAAEHVAEMTAAVTEALPSARLASYGEGLDRASFDYFAHVATAEGRWSSSVTQAYFVDGPQKLLVASRMGDGRAETPCGRETRGAGNDPCDWKEVDGRMVGSSYLIHGGDHSWLRTVLVFTDDGAARTSTVTIFAYAPARSDPFATLPSVQTLTALALDERLLPPQP